jgi:hypothetical protein
MAQALQHDPTALGAQLSAASSADIRALGSPSRWDHANAVISNPVVQKIHQVMTIRREIAKLGISSNCFMITNCTIATFGFDFRQGQHLTDIKK